MIEIGRHTLIIGERINPTGRRKLTEELEKGNLEFVIEEARTQAEAGADVIDVNVGTPAVDEVVLLKEAVAAVHRATGLPVSADSANPPALLATIGTVPDIIVNSVTGDPDFMEEILPAVAESGAVLIGITKDLNGIPATVGDRMAMASRIIDKAISSGIPKERIMIDFLTVPVSAEPRSAEITLECIGRAGPELGIGTVLGASNISFGMPARSVMTASFLSMAIYGGLSAAIVNPLEPGVVQSILAADVMVGRDRMGRRFLSDFRKRRKDTGP